MHDYPIIIFAALLAYVFGLFSKLSEHSPITGPMVFVAVGILAGPLGFGWLKVSVNTELVRVMAEIALVLILFIDASLINLPALIRTPGDRLHPLPAHRGWKAGHSRTGICAFDYRPDRTAECPGPRGDRRSAGRRLRTISFEKKQAAGY